MGDKRTAEEMESEVTYEGRFSEDEPSDIQTKISSLSSDGNFRKRSFNKGLIPYARRRRKSKQGSDSSDWEVASASFHSRTESRRLMRVSSVLREPLRDNLFDHCFRNIWRESTAEKRKACTYLNCWWFYMYTKEHCRQRVLTWIKKEKIFSKRYVFVPIVLWSHWFLLIFCHLGESLESNSRTPCMLLLDSLHTLGPLRLEPLLRRFVLDIYETEDRPECKDMVQNIPLLVPQVPQQRNGEECGIFVLYYTNLFLENAPENFSVSEGYPYFMKPDWFTYEELEGFYKRLESLGTESSDSEE
ncbi:probable ubiquitin-like-specific protease 2A isoform X2 [Sesamum indicum]|uniref:Probable ubiquitin-like-specific protease 2A isoform X2 n=1 Tax=Sesamum indicum TaxID=4182 RepID=A0A8M8V1W3_SESIN|nr:probable ubiquitin-like-specific protease 2A isoform X2 [Sesamum indicum]